MVEIDASLDVSRPIEIERKDRRTLYGALRGFVAGVFSSDGGDSPPPPVLKRVKRSFEEQAPYLREASRNSANDLLRWTREGSPLRALFVISVSGASVRINKV